MILNTKFFRHFFLVVVFCLLTGLELAFFAHFSVWGAQLNLVFLAVFLLGFFEKREGRVGLWGGLAGGLLLDIFSTLPFGVFTFTLLLLAFLIKKSHVLFHKSNPAAFIVVFFLSFLFYKVCLWLLGLLLVLIFESKLLFTWPIKLAWLVEFLYNFIIAGLVFLVFKLKKWER